MNKNKAIAAILVILLIAIGVLIVVLPTVGGQISRYPMTIVDDLGREVALSKAPEKIVSLSASGTEILFALDLGDRVVGVSDYCDYPPEALEKEKIGGVKTPSVEKIVALHPDLVLATDVNPKEIVWELEGWGLTVFGIKEDNLDDLLNDINTVGKITGTETKAEMLTTEMEGKIKTVTNKTKGLSPEDKLRVFYICWHDPIYTAGRGAFVHELIEKAGGVNIFEDLEGWISVNIEELIVRDPEVIIVTAMGGQGSGTWEWVNTEPLLEDISARKNGRIYYIESNWLERPGPRAVLGLENMARYFYPELFD